MMRLDVQPPPVPPAPPLREWYCRHCQKLLGRFDLPALRGVIRCPRCGVDNSWPRGV